MIPVNEPLLGKEEFNKVAACLKTNWISSQGKYLNEFEEKFAHYCGLNYGISTTSGTTALHLALAALGIGPGDEVLIPTFTMAATAFAVCYCGATPVFIDSEPETYNIDPERVSSYSAGPGKKRQDQGQGSSCRFICMATLWIWILCWKWPTDFP